MTGIRMYQLEAICVICHNEFLFLHENAVIARKIDIGFLSEMVKISIYIK